MLINVFGCLVPVGRSKQALHRQRKKKTQILMMF